MILLDANIFMYAAGEPHPHKEPSVALLSRVAQAKLEAVIDAETLQEILHRYRMLNRWQDGKRVYDLARQIVPQVLPITGEVLDGARKLLDTYPHLMARDALHAVVYETIGAEALCSYDQDFDSIAGMRRSEPSHYL